MSDDDDNSQVTGGGKKKSNGHKAACKCPICKNMQMKKGGSMPTLRPANFVGGKKANGHKATCKCPICVNMKHQKASKKNRRVSRQKGGLTRKGGRMIPPSATPTEVEGSDEYALIPPDNNNNVAPPLDESFDEEDLANMNDVRDDEERQPGDNANVGNRLFGDDDDNDDPAQGGKKKRKSNGHKANCKCPICKNMKMKRGGALDDPSDSDSDSSSDSDSDAAMGGGKKKRKGNGHKANCKCPICKNMKMKKGGVGPYADDNKEQKDPNENRDLEMGSEDEEAKEYQAKRSKKPEPKKPEPKPTDGLPRPFTVGKGGSRRRRKSRKSRKSRKIRRRR